MSTPARCPKCAASSKDFEKQKPGFGGYWKTICRQCGYTIASGRKTADTEE